MPLSERLPSAQSALLRAALGLVRGVSGDRLTVELYAATGGATVLEAPAIFHAEYAPGDTVVALFPAGEVDAAVIIGRIGNLADRFTPANVLARLLEVDGPGSGVNADLVDGQHEAALLRADGSRALSGDWDAGSGRAIGAATVRARSSDGLALEDDGGSTGVFIKDGGAVAVGHRAPVCPLDVRAAADGIIALFTADDGSDTASFGLYGYTSDYATSYYANNILFYATTATSALIMAAANASGEIRFTTGGAPSTTTERMRLTNAGVGVGVTAPQGRLHVHDGDGGDLFVSKSAIATTAVTLIPNGTGDVTGMIHIDAIVGNGSARTWVTCTLELGGTTTQNVTLGSDTYQFRLNADGSLDVRRTAGSNAGKVTLRALWV